MAVIFMFPTEQNSNEKKKKKKTEGIWCKPLKMRFLASQQT